MDSISFSSPNMLNSLTQYLWVCCQLLFVSLHKLNNSQLSVSKLQVFPGSWGLQGILHSHLFTQNSPRYANQLNLPENTLFVSRNPAKLYPTEGLAKCLQLIHGLWVRWELVWEVKAYTQRKTKHVQMQLNFPPKAVLENSCKYTNMLSCIVKGAICFTKTSWYGARFFLANKQNTMEKFVNNGFLETF